MRWLADENSNNDILRALFRRNRALDVVRVQDVGLSGVEDPTLLAWAAETTWVLPTHDVSTISAYAYDRVKKGHRMPGVFAVSRDVQILVAV